MNPHYKYAPPLTQTYILIIIDYKLKKAKFKQNFWVLFQVNR